MPVPRHRALDWLPRGDGLPDKTWIARHRWVVGILAVQCAALLVFSIVRGHGVGNSLMEAVVPTLMALLASSPHLGKQLRSCIAAAGLMAISMGLVHVSGGYIEAHFHFFAMIPIVAMYESWTPFLLAVLLVQVHKLVAGAVDPAAIYNHPAALAHPSLWAGVHFLALLGACIGAGINWKAQERLRDARARLADQLVHQANHDPLTGLPSRSVFMDRLEQSLNHGRRRGDGASVLMLDMDGFKEVNDVFGHASGDQVLCEVARRISSVVRADDTVTRLGGDEYAVVLAGADAAAAERIAARLAEQLAEPFELGDVSVNLEVSIGIATGRPDEDASTVTRNADVAMYHAKEQRLGRAHFEDHLMLNGSASGARLDLLGDLRRALQEHEIVLHYQPKVDLLTGRMVGVEALARWQHPQRGLLQPGAFIDIMERTNLSGRFTHEVLSLALAQTRRWADAGLEVPVAVNLSRRCLLDPALPDSVAAALAEHGVPSRLLILEITEMTVMSEPETAVGILHRLRALGVRVSLDDFGTGYSSLAYLKDLPIDELKIDRSFVQHLAQEGSRNSILVRATVELAHDLGLSVVAEGVEDEATQRRLGVLDCDHAQGFHFARPMPAAALSEWLGGPLASSDQVVVTPV